MQLRSTIEMIREQKLKTYESRVDVGHEFYLTAEATDLDKIMVKVSREYFVELNQDEAFRFVDKKEKLMNQQIDFLQTKMAEARAHMSFVKQAVGELLNIT